MFFIILAFLSNKQDQSVATVIIVLVTSINWLLILVLISNRCGRLSYYDFFFFFFGAFFLLKLKLARMVFYGLKFPLLPRIFNFEDFWYLTLTLSFLLFFFMLLLKLSCLTKLKKLSKVVSAALLLVCFLSLKESICETRKNVF